MVLQRHIFPLHRQGVARVEVLDGRFVVLGRVEVSHQRRHVLRCGQPRVRVVAGEQEAACGDGDVAHHVPVERKVEAQHYHGSPSVRLGQHLVRDHLCRHVLVLQVHVELFAVRVSRTVPSEISYVVVYNFVNKLNPQFHNRKYWLTEMQMGSM